MVSHEHSPEEEPGQQSVVNPTSTESSGIESAPENQDQIALEEESLESGGLHSAAAKAFGTSAEEGKALDKLEAMEDTAAQFFRKATEDCATFQAVTGMAFPFNQFQLSEIPEPSRKAKEVMENSLAAVKRRAKDGSLYDREKRVSKATLDELCDLGYWGLLVPEEYGGLGITTRQFQAFITEMAKLDPTVAGLASVHGCIGAVDPVKTFGTEEQKQRLLPALAQGRPTSAFALTEPAAGSDLNAVTTKAFIVGDYIEITGEKLFITNIDYGRRIGVVCKMDGKDVVVIADLPEQETENFRFVEYDIIALKRTKNQGMVFNQFKVPKSNLLDPTMGGKYKADGLTVAYHGLNLGRTALCANAAGSIAMLMANCLPWIHGRVTMDRPIGTRTLVESKLASMAGRVITSEKLADLVANTIDEGGSGEIEGIIAKVYGSEALQQSALDFKDIHGGRSFLADHLFADNFGDLIAPTIYEGSGDMLSMKLLATLVKPFGNKYLRPLANGVGKLVEEGKLPEKMPKGGLEALFYNLKLLAYLPKEALSVGTFMADRTPRQLFRTTMSSGEAEHSTVPPELAPYGKFAVKELQKSWAELTSLVLTHKIHLAELQELINDVSRRVQTLVAIAATVFGTKKNADKIEIMAAQVSCDDLKRSYTGERKTLSAYKLSHRLGKEIYNGNFNRTDASVRVKLERPYPALEEGASEWMEPKA